MRNRSFFGELFSNEFAQCMDWYEGYEPPFERYDGPWTRADGLQKLANPMLIVGNTFDVYFSISSPLSLSL